jgi:hypothetical protein
MSKTDDYQSTFTALRKILKPYEPKFAVVADEPGRYYLACKTATTKSGLAIWFGGVEIKKNYVSPAHLEELAAVTKKGCAGFC